MKAFSSKGASSAGNQAAGVDVRAALLRGLDLSRARDALDLGCGFGFVAEAIAQRAPGVRIVGIDSRPVNAEPFVRAVTAAGGRPEFRAQRLVDRLDDPSDSFDLVVASNSLYFFPALVPEIARVVRPAGVFVAATSSEASCRELLAAAGLGSPAARLLDVIHRFSAENAEGLLAPHFGRIERSEEREPLVFEPAQYDDFLRYLWFRMAFLAHEAGADRTPSAPFAEALRGALAKGERLEVARHDVVLRCYEPRG